MMYASYVTHTEPAMDIATFALHACIDANETDAIALLATLTSAGYCTTLAMLVVRDAVHAGLVSHT